MQYSFELFKIQNSSRVLRTEQYSSRVSKAEQNSSIFIKTEQNSSYSLNRTFHIHLTELLTFVMNKSSHS